MTAAEKEKRTPKFLRKIFESPKKNAERLKSKTSSNVDSGRGGKDSARQKMYDKTSMFAKKAATRDTAKTKIVIDHLNLHSMLLKKQVRVLSLMVEETL